MMKTAFLVTGETGECGDFRKWSTEVCATAEIAQTRVDFFNALATKEGIFQDKPNGGKLDLDDFDALDNATKVLRANGDSMAYADYTGVFYSYRELPFFDQLTS